MIRPHLFPGTGYSTEVTPGIFAGAPLGGGPPRCRDWTSNQNSLLKLKYSPWLNAFYIHMYIDTKKWNMSQFDQQLRYKWRNELQGELQFKELQKRSKKNLSLSRSVKFLQFLYFQLICQEHVLYLVTSPLDNTLVSKRVNCSLQMPILRNSQLINLH